MHLSRMTILPFYTTLSSSFDGCLVVPEEPWRHRQERSHRITFHPVSRGMAPVKRQGGEEHGGYQIEDRSRAPRRARADPARRAGADHDRHRVREREGRAGRRDPRRDRRAHQRNARARSRRPPSPTRPATTCSPTSRADTYTVEVTLEAFKTVKRAGIAVSGGDRVGIPPLTLEPGALAETVTVIAESPLVQTQSGERSFAVTTKQIENLPIARNNFTSLTAFTPGVVQTGASAGGTRLGGAGQNNIMMDGISAMDTGNNGQMLQHERRLDRRGEDPDAGLPGRVRPLERPADHRGHQERHEPVPRVGLRHPDQLGLGREQLGQQQERRSEAEDQHQDARLHASAVRSASRAATTSCSSSTRTSIVR